MGLFIGAVITFAFLAFIAHCIVEAYTEKKDITIWVKVLYKVIVGVFLFGMLILLGKCGCASECEYTPSGETTLEHYEPR